MGYRHYSPQRDGQYKPSLIPVDVENEDMRVIVLAHGWMTVTGTGINILRERGHGDSRDHDRYGGLRDCGR